MPRTRTVTWTYDCDALGCGNHWPGGPGYLEVHRGDRCDTARGTEVRDQVDADAVARQAGWQLTHGGRQVFCPSCVGGGCA